MITWGKVLGIQTKVTVFIIGVVVFVLSASTYLSRTLTEQKAEENLRERYINIVKQIDAGIVEIEELRDTRTLQEELEKLLQVRPNIVIVDIFDLTSEKVRLTARKSMEMNRPVSAPDSTNIEAVKRGEVLTSLEMDGDDRFWNILAPVRIRSERLAAAGQVAAAIAHSIGTPLHSILGHLHRLKRDTSEDKREERLKIIHSQVERVVQIIQDLLDTVRKPAPSMVPVRINQLLEELLYLVTPGISLRGINVKTNLYPLLPDITGDVNQLQELFLNLLTNAMDAMLGGGELEVNTGINQIAERSKETITITIKDNGHGIDEVSLQKIFEPFFTTKERNRGTGLGLSICRDITKTHHGEIYVSSHVGKGTTFTIVLPVKDYETT